MSLARVVRRRTVSTAAAVALSAGIAVATGAGAATSASAACTPRVLILGAMPSEIGVVLKATTVEKRVTVGDRRFYVGKLAGKNVVLAMTAIGLVNSQQTADAAFKRSVGGAWGRPRVPLAIARALKDRFDPHGILAPGRVPLASTT